MQQKTDGEPLRPLPPVAAAPLIREVDEALVDLLRELQPADWSRPAVGRWSVREVAAHLLDGSLRRLSLQRDGHRLPVGPPAQRGCEGLVDHLDELNARWIAAAERLSPRVIIDLLAWVSPQVADLFGSLEPEGEAAFPVAWAGESASRAWMDVAREFIERWHHQQQIREAVEARWLDDWRFVEPLLQSCIRALPRSYAEVAAPERTAVRIEVFEPRELSWLLQRGKAGWGLFRATDQAPIEASIRLTAEIAWRLFTKGISGSDARAAAVVTGPRSLTDPFFSTLAVMA